MYILNRMQRSKLKRLCIQVHVDNNFIEVSNESKTVERKDVTALKESLKKMLQQIQETLASERTLINQSSELLAIANRSK